MYLSPAIRRFQTGVFNSDLLTDIDLSAEYDSYDVTSFVRHYFWQESSNIVIVDITAANDDHVRPSITVQEMVQTLRKDGMPVSAIADAARVERKTVYAWLNGGPVREHNYERLVKIYELLMEGKKAELRNLYRLWNRSLENGATLNSLLSAEQLDEFAIRHFLSALWPLAKRYQDQISSSTGVLGVADRSNRSNPYLSEVPEATLERD